MPRLKYQQELQICSILPYTRHDLLAVRFAFVDMLVDCCIKSQPWGWLEVNCFSPSACWLLVTDKEKVAFGNRKHRGVVICPLINVQDVVGGAVSESLCEP